MNLLQHVPQASGQFSSSAERIRMELGQELERPGEEPPYVYFPESGIASVIAVSTSKKVETAMIGFEGMTGTSLVLGGDRAPLLVLVQAPGWALRLSREDFLATLDVPDLHRLWLRYAHVLMVQITHTALANGTGTLVQRLARWLVMWSDRVQEPNFRVTHDYIAVLLGVRRAGITVALHILEGEHLIRSDRNHIAVLDRAGLVAAAAGFYGAPEEEYQRLIG